MRFLFFFSALATCLQANVRKDVEVFLEQHCYDCHDDIDNEGGLNLLDLKFDPENPENRGHSSPNTPRAARTRESNISRAYPAPTAARS